MAYDVFISYASKDKLVADAVCARLEASGIRCWIAPRDIVAGRSYGEAIIEAIHTTKVMVLVFSSNANSSGHIPKEVERAVSNSLTIVPFRIEGVAPGKSLDYFIGSVHWLDAMTPPMETHLDKLAATVHKLLPERTGEKPEPPTSGVWQRSAPPVAAPVIQPPVIATPATASQPAPAASNSKTLWIVIAAAVLLLVAGAWGWNMMRGNGGGGTVSDGGGSSLTETPASAGAAGTVAGGNPIVGCYQWFNNGAVVIHGDGTVIGGPFKARWREVNAAARSYKITWPEAVDTLTVAASQQTLSGANQYGVAASGTRLTPGIGLVGTWRWINGLPVIINADGTSLVGPFRGRWRAVDASRGLYTITWPNPVDSLTLSPDGSRLSGVDNYGIAISGTRTGACAGN